MIRSAQNRKLEDCRAWLPGEPRRALLLEYGVPLPRDEPHAAYSFVTFAMFKSKRTNLNEPIVLLKGPKEPKALPTTSSHLGAFIHSCN